MTIDAYQTLPSALSPSLRAGGRAGPAFELKFLLGTEEASTVEAWVRQRLTPDPHGDNGRYRVTTVYCDTPALDVFHRSPGFRRSKYRLRRYGTTPVIHLERKRKRGDRVRKKRDALHVDQLQLLETIDPEPDLTWGWFPRQLRARGLRPTARVAYDRTAFVGTTNEGDVRLTLDRHVIGVPASLWDVPPLGDGKLLLPDQVLLELKFHASLPGLFRELLDGLPPAPARASKYRLCVSSWGLNGEGR